MAVTWSITNTEYNNDSDKGVVHAAWSATNSEIVGSGDSAVTHSGTVSGMESYCQILVRLVTLRSILLQMQR